MNKFFVPNEVYEDRIAICRSCVYYKSLLGNCSICKCFMKVKARIAPLACPQKYWDKTTEVETPDTLPQEIVDEILDMWKDLKTGRAKDQAAKKTIQINKVSSKVSYQKECEKPLDLESR